MNDQILIKLIEDALFVYVEQNEFVALRVWNEIKAHVTSMCEEHYEIGYSSGFDAGYVEAERYYDPYEVAARAAREE